MRDLNQAKLLFVLLLVIFLGAAGPPRANQSKMRKWTSSDGKFTVVAQLVDFKETMVRLKKEDGKVITVPIAKLSKADQEFVKKPTEAANAHAADEEVETKLTVARAASNLDACKGKRVRWYAKLSSVVGERATYINNPNARTATSFRLFAVKLNSFDEGAKYDGGYITGTIIGSAAVPITTGTRGGAIRTEERMLPLLGDVSFEKAPAPRR